MKKSLRIFFVAGLLFAAHSAVNAQFGSICGDPSQTECAGQYDGFAAHDLIFNTGRAELGTGTRHESDEFYAVVLESVKAEKPNGGCRFVGEIKRRAAQKLFARNKVFASREYCRGTIVRYSGANENYNFTAVYAGDTEVQAAAVLKKAKKRYPSANIRKMTIVLDFADE